jgi:hypothetical protein
VLARRDGRGRPWLQLLHAHGAVAPRGADGGGGQAGRGPEAGVRVAGVHERAGVHDVDDGLQCGGGGAAAGAAGDGLALSAGSAEAAARVAPERRLHAAGARHRQRHATVVLLSGDLRSERIDGRAQRLYGHIIGLLLGEGDSASEKHHHQPAASIESDSCQTKGTVFVISAHN